MRRASTLVISLNERMKVLITGFMPFTRVMVRSGRSTRNVRSVLTDTLDESGNAKVSKPADTMTRSRQFQLSRRYACLCRISPRATILIATSIVKTTVKKYSENRRKSSVDPQSSHNSTLWCTICLYFSDSLHPSTTKPFPAGCPSTPVHRQMGSSRASVTQLRMMRKRIVLEKSGSSINLIRRSRMGELLWRQYSERLM